jgi:hypothetical protein
MVHHICQVAVRVEKRGWDNICQATGRAAGRRRKYVQNKTGKSWLFRSPIICHVTTAVL